MDKDGVIRVKDYVFNRNMLEGGSLNTLVALLKPRLSADENLELVSLYSNLKGNSISKEEFFEGLVVLVGYGLLKPIILRARRQIQDAEEARYCKSLNDQTSSDAIPQSSLDGSEEAEYVSVRVIPYF